ncbi:hypothetical protein FHL02_02315 [Lactobacillus salsicarnum]|uniref:MucBP domain-containing protein n=2 Tax=Companilactobacillus mishanensis TaxID=2486008 RepID=A0A5P0ZFR0_9LACO|nr:hypothetical protein [Companilactobacillus mishanensis]MQS51848.1 hypothetical protein [Companilactobacillus mishanensis]MQS89036.1 hypothetical protein [Companilactobacillus mishanensis]
MENNLLNNDQVKKISRDDVEIEVHYIDSLGNQLADSTYLTGHYLDNLEMPWKTIPGYVLSSIKNFQQSFIPNDDGIYLIYFTQIAAPVIVYHRNTKGELIADPQYLTGDLNKSYQAEPLEEARNFLVDYPKSVKGHFSDKVQEYEFIYDTMQMADHEVPSNLFIQTKNNVPVYEQPAGKQPLSQTLPYDTTWRVFKAVQENYNETVWYNLGGNIWISEKEEIKTFTIDQFNEEQKLLSSPLGATVNNISFTYTVVDSMDIERSVKVLFYANQYVTAWETPYGTIVSNRYQGGQSVFVKRLIQLDNQSVWAELDDGHYMESKYLNL